MPKEKQGRLIPCNLKDIGEHVGEGAYDWIFGSWALCYLAHQDLEPVVQTLAWALADGGTLILKETVLRGG